MHNTLQHDSHTLRSSCRKLSVSGLAVCNQRSTSASTVNQPPIIEQRPPKGYYD